jgi:HlyD family secretion protein
MAQNTEKKRSRIKLGSTLLLLSVAAGAGALGSIGIARSGVSFANEVKDEAAAKPAKSPITWIAAAPGRIEPKSGQVRVGAQLLGRIADVTVKLNDTVEEGELLIRLDDEEARARLQAAETEASSRKRERDSQTLDKAREDVRKAEDNVFSAERALTNARFGLGCPRVGRPPQPDQRQGSSAEGTLQLRDCPGQARCAGPEPVGIGPSGLPFGCRGCRSSA